MGRFRVLGAFIVAALLIGAAAAGSASAAAPEVGRCVKVATKGGKFSSAACTKEKAGGSYEWYPGVVKGKFTTSGGKGILTAVGGKTVACTSESSGGEYSSPKEELNVVVTFKGCESAGLKCRTPGAAEGELVTNSLEGELGFESKAKHKIGLDLFPGKTAGGLFITFNCSTLHLQVRGSVLVNVKSDKMLSSTTLKYKDKKGHQEPEQLEGQPKDVLEVSFNETPFEQAGQEITATVTGEEAVEANAYF